MKIQNCGSAIEFVPRLNGTTRNGIFLLLVKHLHLPLSIICQ